jgi:circadian clock protein KaiC
MSTPGSNLRIDGRCPTGIPGFDAMTRGGFVSGDSVLISGSAGLGKTTFGVQYLYNGIKKYDENGISLTFEELPQQIYRDSKNFGWDIKKLEDEGKMKVICTSPTTVTDPEVLATIIDKGIESIKARRMLVDSLTVVELFAEDINKRASLYRFINHFKARKVTTLFTYEAQETFGGGQTRGSNPISFLVDTVITLRHAELNGELRRTIAIMKMRGSDHDKDIKEYAITNKGFELKASLKGYEGLLTGTPRLATKLSSALESL